MTQNKWLHWVPTKLCYSCDISKQRRKENKWLHPQRRNSLRNGLPLHGRLHLIEFIFIQTRVQFKYSREARRSKIIEHVHGGYTNSLVSNVHNRIPQRRPCWNFWSQFSFRIKHTRELIMVTRASNQNLSYVVCKSSILRQTHID